MADLHQLGLVLALLALAISYYVICRPNRIQAPDIILLFLAVALIAHMNY